MVQRSSFLCKTKKRFNKTKAQSCDLQTSHFLNNSSFSICEYKDANTPHLRAYIYNKVFAGSQSLFNAAPFPSNLSFDLPAWNLVISSSIKVLIALFPLAEKKLTGHISLSSAYLRIYSLSLSRQRRHLQNLWSHFTDLSRPGSSHLLTQGGVRLGVLKADIRSRWRRRRFDRKKWNFRASLATSKTRAERLWP